MRYRCPKCAETFAAKPPSGTCPICDAVLVPEPEGQDTEWHRESEGIPSPKRRL